MRNNDIPDSDRGLEVHFRGSGLLTVENNTVVSSREAIRVDTIDPGVVAVGLRGNTLTSNSNPSINFLVRNASLCCEIVGNTTNHDVTLVNDGATLEVERLAQLASINTIGGQVMNSGAVPVAQGACQIP